jgi:hypothetical protein
VLETLNSEHWAPVGALEIFVRDGVVDLWGSIMDERERRALIVAVENTPGVKAVKDHLALVDATTGFVICQLKSRRRSHTRRRESKQPRPLRVGAFEDHHMSKIMVVTAPPNRHVLRGPVTNPSMVRFKGAGDAASSNPGGWQPL